MQSSGIQRAQVGDLEIAYETFGDAGDPPILLVMGLATQMIGWPDEVCGRLADRGSFVGRVDNRDIGLSTHLDSAGAPDILTVLGGDASSVPYGLADLADDTVGLLDALGLDSVHLIGASMGGMIAQLVALRHPARVRSVTSIMSTTHDPSGGCPPPATWPSAARRGRPWRSCWLRRPATATPLASASSTPTGSSARRASSSTRAPSGGGPACRSTAPTTRPASPGSWPPSSPRPTAPGPSRGSPCPPW